MARKEDNVGQCGICHLAVRHVDDYVKIEDYIKGKIKSTGYFHRSCFRDKLASTSEMKTLQDMAKDLMTKTNKILTGSNL